MARKATHTDQAEPAAMWRFTGRYNRAGNPLEFFTGIPARDLTEPEFNGLSDDDQAIVRLSPLYEAAGGQPPNDPPSGQEGGEGGDTNDAPPAE